MFPRCRTNKGLLCGWWPLSLVLWGVTSLHDISMASPSVASNVSNSKPSLRPKPAPGIHCTEGQVCVWGLHTQTTMSDMFRTEVKAVYFLVALLKPTLAFTAICLVVISNSGSRPAAGSRCGRTVHCIIPIIWDRSALCVFLSVCVCVCMCVY